MILSRPDSLMQAVLDREASAAEWGELDRLLSADPALRAKFQLQQRVCVVLEAVPEVDPPAGLVECILVRATLRGSRQAATHQPMSRERVAAKDARPERLTRGNWFSGLVHLFKETGMSEQKRRFLGTTGGRLLVIAGIAGVALVGVSSIIEFPIGGTSTSGTIVPAERHRASQNSAADINVGLPGGAQSKPAAGTIPNISGTGIAAGNAVTANALNPNAVSADAVTANAVTANAVTANAVSANAVTANAVTANAVTANAVTANAVTANAVTANAVTANAVTANAVTANAVTANAVSANAKSN